MGLFDSLFGKSAAAAPQQQQMQQFPIPPNPFPFSAKEEERLQELVVEWATQIKQQKINAFKSLNQELRQRIIDSIQLHHAIEKLNTPDGMPNMPIEMQNLLDKKEMNIMQGRNGWGRPLNLRHDYMQHAFMPQFKIHPSSDTTIEMNTNNLCGLTLNDLIKAHTDVTVDEEVLGDKP